MIAFASSNGDIIDVIPIVDITDIRSDGSSTSFFKANRPSTSSQDIKKHDVVNLDVDNDEKLLEGDEEIQSNFSLCEIDTEQDGYNSGKSYKLRTSVTSEFKCMLDDLDRLAAAARKKTQSSSRFSRKTFFMLDKSVPTFVPVILFFLNHLSMTL